MSISNVYRHHALSIDGPSYNGTTAWYAQGAEFFTGPLHVYREALILCLQADRIRRCVHSTMTFSALMHIGSPKYIMRRRGFALGNNDVLPVGPLAHSFHGRIANVSQVASVFAVIPLVTLNLVVRFDHFHYFCWRWARGKFSFHFVKLHRYCSRLPLSHESLAFAALHPFIYIFFGTHLHIRFVSLMVLSFTEFLELNMKDDAPDQAG